MTSIAYPEVCRSPMTGERLKVILEEVADNLFHADPYYQQGGDMIRCGGVGYTIEPRKPIGQRVTDMTLLKGGRRIEPDKEYIVASWACTADTVEGPPIWDLVERYIARKKVIRVAPVSVISRVGR